MYGTFRSRTTYLLIIGLLLISLEEEQKQKTTNFNIINIIFNLLKFRLSIFFIFFIFSEKKCCKEEKLENKSRCAQQPCHRLAIIKIPAVPVLISLFSFLEGKCVGH
jgi:hypothetical protein